METIKELQIEREKIKKGCGKKLSEQGYCAYQGKNVWRMCPSCRIKLDEISIRICILSDVSNLIYNFINKEIGWGGVQTANFTKLRSQITG